MYLCLKSLLFLQVNNYSASSDTLDLEIESFSIGAGIIALICHLFIWAILALYLDQVFPNEFGVKKHPLFFIPGFYSKSEKVDHLKTLESDK